MINNFMCKKCDHQFVCEKLTTLLKFDESAKKDLKVTITMDECLDYKDKNESGEDE